ncbi:MAG: hypothetical protein ACRDRH_25595 [Pseudonocardia sp.]
MAGRRRRNGRRTRDVIPERRTVEMVDITTLQAHLLSDDAVTPGRHGGHYTALCGTDVTPAAMVEPGRGYCRSCSSSATIPPRETR